MLEDAVGPKLGQERVLLGLREREPMVRITSRATEEGRRTLTRTKMNMPLAGRTLQQRKRPTVRSGERR